MAVWVAYNNNKYIKILLLRSTKLNKLIKKNMATTLQQAQERFGEAGFSRVGRYEEGTKGKGASWNASKARAKTNFAPAMQEALQKDAYGKGLEKADANTYDRGVMDKGVNNWPVGMQASKSKYQKNIAPFVPLWSADLPTAPQQRRSAANLKRMTENVQRFIQAAGK